ncbi:MAG: hypothetical protein ACI9GZ_003981 [Bacteroidia bacterium]
MIFSEVKRHLSPFFLLTVIAFCCAETQEEYFNDPTIRVQFINADTLVHLADSLEITNDSLVVVNDTINYFTDSLTVLTDSLVILADSIDSGKNEYVRVRDEFLITQIAFINTLIILEGNAETLSDIKSQLSSTISDVNNGKILISSITNLENGFFLSFVDSAADYFLPMSMNADISRLAVEIDNNSYDIELAYLREDFRDEKKRIRVSISNLEIVNHDFDSISCQSLNCENETPVKFYF